MEWRLIRNEDNGFMNMALDEAMMESASEMPIIRLYDWSPPCVSLGYFQRYDDIDGDFCKENGIDVVRRITGGRAIYHNQDEITYSVIAPEGLFGNVEESYREICSWIIKALSDVGIEGQIEKSNDIVVGGRKISGNAQTRVNGILLQHGTIIVEKNLDVMSKAIAKGSVSTDELDKRISSVREEAGLNKEEMIEHLSRRFREGKEILYDMATDEEMNRAANLMKSKYGTEKWNINMPGKSRGMCYFR